MNKQLKLGYQKKYLHCVIFQIITGLEKKNVHLLAIGEEHLFNAICTNTI